MSIYLNTESNIDNTHHDNSIVITANVAGDASMMHMGASLVTEYKKHGYSVQGALEQSLEACEPFKYIVLNRVGVGEFPDAVAKKNLQLVDRWISDPNKFVTYYIDDLLVHLNNNLPIEFMKRCENVVTSNHVLKNYLEEHCYIPEARIVPTHVNYDFVDNIKPVNHVIPMKEDHFKIYWASLGRIGTRFMIEFLRLANEIEEFKEIDIMCVGMNIMKTRMQIAQFRNVNLYFHEALSLDKFFALGKTCDMMINPVSLEELAEFYDDENMQKLWLSSKCEPKFAAAGAMRIPLLSGNMRAYTEAINDGKDGFISDDPKEWIDIILELKKNKDLRTYIGNNARKRAETTYDYKQRTLDYIKAFTQPAEDDDE